MKNVIAIDLGASNGRLIAAQLNNGYLTIEELHRFPNTTFEKDNHLFWDINFIFDEIKTGLKMFKQNYNISVDSVGVDTWGVDFGLLSREGNLLEDPYSYRDTHTIHQMPEVHKEISQKDLFKRTGVESASINTLYQLFTIFKQRIDLRNQTTAILTLPSLINYLLTGVKANEFTHASTTQLLNWQTKNWDEKIVDGIFHNQLPLVPIQKTNSIIGHIKSDICAEIGMDHVPVINVPGHDTACALASMPLENEHTAFMSCGTWVLIGVVVEKPVVTDEAYHWGFTNEGTANQTYRLQKNNMGLWILQQCKKEWQRNGEKVSYEEADELIRKAVPFRSIIDPDHDLFFNPENMVEAIQEFCRKTNQVIPINKGEIMRCILESLALKYRWVIEKLEKLTDQDIPSIHMAGGGIQNQLLCQFTANSTKKHVQTGPVEASAIGNAICQFGALHQFASLSEGRKIVKQSFEMKVYHPENTSLWDEAYHHFIQYI